MNGVDHEAQQQHVVSASGRRGNVSAAAAVAVVSSGDRDQPASVNSQDRDQKATTSGKWTNKMYKTSAKRYMPKKKAEFLPRNEEKRGFYKAVGGRCSSDRCLIAEW